MASTRPTGCLRAPCWDRQRAVLRIQVMRNAPGLLALLFLPLLACSLDSPGFDPDLWRFVQIVPLRGNTVGGWQEACSHLTFVDDRKLFLPPHQWKCGIKVGMPLATTADGPLSAELAARITAGLATRSAEATIHSRPAWLGEDHCILLRRTMQAGFREMQLGAIVNQC